MATPQISPCLKNKMQVGQMLLEQLANRPNRQELQAPVLQADASGVLFTLHFSGWIALVRHPVLSRCIFMQ